jgi:hypothetical protein
LDAGGWCGTVEWCFEGRRLESGDLGFARCDVHGQIHNSGALGASRGRPESRQDDLSGNILHVDIHSGLARGAQDVECFHRLVRVLSVEHPWDGSHDGDDGIAFCRRRYEACC